MSRRPYVRPMKRTWYMDHPFYRQYMVRESSCVFDGLYAINLFVGLMQLVKGEAAWNSWLAFQANPLMILFTVVTLGLTIYHAVTYFDMTPRVLPQQIRKMIKDSVVNKLMYVGLAVVSAIILAAATMGL
ncbi:fumarate reductase subunit C [Thalassotalea sp. G20_0]|uniref:fumarate reductase subunit C n=1 Tax=Thalassotalea sp. G20_0 TaxID=2821093 RepID=UPI001AD9569C|nr:fumarate reductase subunit C [Thalassotalea sp. G20_0]MBO9493293.1 fumarate reductase subunit C [Thalassotalea sp. G20_0]